MRLRQSSSPMGSLCEMSNWGQRAPSSVASRVSAQAPTSTGAWGGGTVSQIRGSGPINKGETLMMMGILMLMLMLRVMRG